MNTIKMAKCFNVVPKWRNFAKSGRTGWQAQTDP